MGGQGQVLHGHQLQKLLKADEGGEGGDKVANPTYHEDHLKLKPDQVDIVQQALIRPRVNCTRARHRGAGEHLQRLRGQQHGIAQAVDLDAVIDTTGFEPLLKRIAEKFRMRYHRAPVEAANSRCHGHLVQRWGWAGWPGSFVGVAVPKNSSASSFDPARLNGVVIRYMADKGFGFLKGEDGQEYFFHRSAVQGNPEDVQPEQAVAFTPSSGPKGLRAEAVVRQ